jgi:hypothetical protein
MRDRGLAGSHLLEPLNRLGQVAVYVLADRFNLLGNRLLDPFGIGTPRLDSREVIRGTIRADDTGCRSHSRPRK